MKKIPTIFKRNLLVMSEILDEPHPDCKWVFAGEGAATRKYDGTCCLVREGKLYKRRVLHSRQPEPEGFDYVEFDTLSGNRLGWVPVDEESKEDRWHREALVNDMGDGTYELVGPKIQGNPEGLHRHHLLKHSEAIHYNNVPRTFEGLREWMKDKDIEGIVFHHPDGRMGKIKKRDYGQKRG